jgi:hypothetical protein
VIEHGSAGVVVVGGSGQMQLCVMLMKRVNGWIESQRTKSVIYSLESIDGLKKLRICWSISTFLNDKDGGVVVGGGGDYRIGAVLSASRFDWGYILLSNAW